MLTQSLHALSDDTLLARLAELLRDSRRIEADLVAHIAEVEERRLFLREACSSMFVYCLERLHLSEPEAYLRLAVARASRRYPLLLEMLRDGRLHLTAIALLAPYLNDANVERVLRRATHRTKRQVEELVAELAPRSDVPATVRRLPEKAPAAVLDLPGTPEAPRADFASALPAPAAASPLPDETLAVRVVSPSPRLDEVHPVTTNRAQAATVTPLAPSRYKVQFTASQEFRDKLEELQALLGSQDLAKLLEEAVAEKLERVKARRLAHTNKPRRSVAASDTRPGRRRIPNAVKRTVWKRDGGRCAFVDARGRRCSERRHLQFHHRHPHGYGGDRSPENISLRCRSHNGYEAEVDYGRPRERLNPAQACRSTPPSRRL